MANLTLGSLFDGSGGFLGGLLTGIKPLWARKSNPFPTRVTTKRIPQMKHYGDISKLDGKLPPVNIITFGPPAQIWCGRKKSRLGRRRIRPFL